MPPDGKTATDSPVNEEPQSEVVAFLADPATHGVGAGEVARVRTHAAELFLAGERAIKIKRAVRYSFLDFTAIERRREACEAEVRLNRRTAPDIYLGVAAIRRAPGGGLALDRPGRPGPGEPVEWAVVMRRFDERRTLDRLAAGNGLRPEWIDALIDAAIVLHERAAPAGAPYGGAEGLRAIIDENEADMAARPEHFAPHRTAALTAAACEALAANGPLLDARREAGLVRRCHGDLHLGNVVMWRGRPTPFDCIEFSDRIATIDVAYDLAFLLMDLETRGLRALANRALGRYLGRQGRIGVLAALPLMLSLRAAVRAKVSAMAVPGQSDPAEAGRLSGLADRFFEAAEAFLAPPSAPRLVAVGGLSGTGKTTLADGLAPGIGRAPGALHLRSDILRKRLEGVAPEERLPARAYTPEADRAVYETLAAEAAEALAAGHSVVADAVFAREADRRGIEAVARNAGAAFDGLWLGAPAGVLLDRVGARRADASDATAAVVRRQLGYETGRIGWRRLDASGGAEAVLAEARAGLGLR